jgi:hypothetical protein
MQPILLVGPEEPVVVYKEADITNVGSCKNLQIEKLNCLDRPLKPDHSRKRDLPYRIHRSLSSPARAKIETGEMLARDIREQEDYIRERIWPETCGALITERRVVSYFLGYYQDRAFLTDYAT